MSETREHLVVGEGFAALSLYCQLGERWGAEHVGMLTPRPPEREDLCPYGIGGGEALVYRDAAFHPVRERMIRSPWERYFLEASEVPPPVCLQEGRDPHQIVGTPHKIEGNPSGGYVVHSGNGVRVACRHIHWMGAPRAFARCYGGELSSQFAQESPGPLYVRYCFEGQVTDRVATFFFPLSYAHDQGHFIGAFQAVGKDGRQGGEFVTFLDMDDTPEEEISKKIRTLDRRLAKAFPPFKRTPHKKSIRISSYLPLPGVGGPFSAPEGVSFSSSLEQ